MSKKLFLLARKKDVNKRVEPVNYGKGHTQYRNKGINNFYPHCPDSIRIVEVKDSTNAPYKTEKNSYIHTMFAQPAFLASYI